MTQWVMRLEDSLGFEKQGCGGSVSHLLPPRTGAALGPPPPLRRTAAPRPPVHTASGTSGPQHRCIEVQALQVGHVTHCLTYQWVIGA